MIDVCLLGTGGMMPLPNRFLTSCLIRHNGNMILIDCGEGTQVPIKILGWGFKNIEAVCFTHFHADHIGGITGLLLMIGNSGREEPLTLIGPKGLKTVINNLRVICPVLPYEIKFIERSNADTEPIKFLGLEINTLPVEHKMPCFAYSLEIKRAGQFDPIRAKAQNVPLRIWSKLQKNDTVVFDGITYTSDMVLGAERKGIKISYCTDCRPNKKISNFINNSDLFIGEGMYGDDEKDTNAIKYKHSTMRETAEIAKAGNVNELWFTHYSPSLVNPEQFIDTAKSIFPNTTMGRDGMYKTISFKD